MKAIKIVFGMALLGFLMSSCGGGGSDSPTGGGGEGDDITAPSGYLIQALELISQANVSSYSFSISDVEPGASYFYSIYDSTSTEPQISSSGRALTSSLTISGLNLSSLSDGGILVEFYLVDSVGNEGNIVSSNTTKDVNAPTGYDISSTITEIDSFNLSDFSFSVTNAEVGTDYVYQIFDSSSSISPVVAGGGEVITEDFELSSIELIDLLDGAVTVEFYLEDASGAGEIRSINLTKNTSVLADPVTVSGTVTFDHIPHSVIFNGLDYDNIQARPARALDVAIYDNNGVQLRSGVTSETGEYSFVVEANTAIQVRVSARMFQNDVAQWNVSVVDNTSSDALYVLAGDLRSSGATDSIRNLHAASGWGTDAYTNTRASGPFAILDAIYQTMQKFVDVDEDVIFPELQINWSVNNSSADGELEDGDIGTSFYTNGQIFILGKADLDTDEYDSHVIVHEWGHYFEDRLSRSDSVGGSHAITEKLDLRVAFGEGWGNALSAMILDDPLYRDSGGLNQASGFSIDVEENTNINEGWFNEGSIQSILYDLYDDQDDGDDTLSLGLGPIYDVLISDNYIDNAYPTSIFPFRDELTNQQSAQVLAIDTLINAQNINGSGASGTGETNDGGLNQILPIYKTVVVNTGSVELCSSDVNGSYNKLGVRDFAYFSVINGDVYTITVSKNTVSAAADPDFILWLSGGFVAVAEEATDNEEALSLFLLPGDYIIEFYDYKILADIGESNQAACYDLSVTN